MADYEIEIPAPDDNINMIAGQTLQITFVEDRRFCSTSGTAGYFTPSLPDGAQVKGYVWIGEALSTGIGKKITHHSVGHDVDCGSRVKRSGNRSIQISGSIPP